MTEHEAIRIEVFVDPLFQENGFLVWPAADSRAWIIDPSFSPQAEQIVEAARTHGLNVEAILLTHCHADHLAGVATVLRELPQAKLWAPRDEAHMLGSAEANLSAPFGVPVTAPPADRLLCPGEKLQLGSTEWQVLDVGGHSPGGLAYYCPAAGVVIVGDALFAGSIGRYDFPGSSGSRLLRNIRQNLLTLPPHTVVYSGHGPRTTIGQEGRFNPFLLEED